MQLDTADTHRFSAKIGFRDDYRCFWDRGL